MRRRPLLMREYPSHPLLAAGILAGIALLTPAPARSDVLSFREGLGGYTGTEDTWFSARTTPPEAPGFPTAGSLATGMFDSGATSQQVLLQFSGIFGAGGIPQGATIESATLALHVPSDVAGSDGEPNAVHQMLVAWTETDAHGSTPWAGGATGGVDTDGAEAAAAAVADSTAFAVADVIPQNTALSFDVTSVVQSWSDSAGTNHGFLLQAVEDSGNPGFGLDGGNTLYVASSEYAGADGTDKRPMLTVDFCDPLDPDDPDGDGLDGPAEQAAGTDPCDADSDDDGLSDGEEVSRLSTVGFGPQQVISTLADSVGSVFAADLDGDGDSDVLSASANDDEIAWYENRLDEASADFGPQQVISTLANFARSVFATDLDGDGDPDVLSASGVDDEIAWYENRLDEVSADFGPQQVISTLADNAYSVFAADLDGDGDPDALSASDGAKIAWYENRLDEASADFGSEQVISTLAGWARSVFAADLDGDGDRDVLSASAYDDEIAWYENRLDEASADFGSQQVLSALADGAFSVFAIDLDGDGDPDVLSASRDDDKIAWYENRLDEASADFGPQQVISALADSARSVFAADLDGDGDPDVLSASAIDDEIAWYENRLDEASADFGPQQVISTLADSAGSVFAADLDGDGDSDVLSASYGDDKIAWYENPGTDPLDPDSDGDGLSDGAEVNTHGSDPNDADSDTDGLDDAAEVNTHGTDPTNADSDADGLDDGSEVSTHGTDPTDDDSDGDGLYDGFEVEAGFDPLVGGEQTQDPDGDGLDNLEEQSAGSDPHDADSDADGLSDGDEVNTHGTDPIDADSDGDGLRDEFEVANGFDPLVAGEQTQDPDGDDLGNLGEQAAGTDPHDADSDDDGLADGEEVSRVSTLGFGPQQIISTLADGAQSVFAADLDGDRDPDVLSASETDDEVAWYENRLDEASADFGPQQVISTLAVSPQSVFSADLDGDGDPDALSASSYDHEIAWYENRLDEASADFGPQQVISTLAGSPQSVFSADLDGDGDRDVLSASFIGDEITWYENRLDEASADFGPQQMISTLANRVRSVFAADLDGDGDPDALSASHEDEEIAWYENRLDETSADFGPQQVISTLVDYAYSVFAADLDGDGDADVLSASQWDDKIAWYENCLDEASADFGPQQVISTLADGAKSIFTADLDSDGDPDVLSASGVDDEIAWYENRLDEASADFGPQQVISTLADGANSVFSADLDGDGDPDVLSASYADDEIAWYENPGTDPLDPDSDGDGLSDGAEVNTHGSDPNDADSDADGLDDGAEVETHGTDPTDSDSDDDGLDDGSEVNTHGTDPTDDDSDDDGLHDGFEVGNGFNPLVGGEQTQDPDDDGLDNLGEQTAGTDPHDADSDDDGLSDGSEVNTHGTDPNDADSDDDVLSDGDEVNTHGTDPNDGDTDDDGLSDGAEVNTHGSDPNDADSDDDGLSDGAEVNTHGSDPNDADSDDDGLSDGAEVNTHGSDPTDADSDDDGLDDGAEVNTHGTDPTDADSDDDGLSDGAEVNTHGTDPNDADSDGDGLNDGFEVEAGFNPLVGGEQTQDPDDDGLENLEEQAAGTDPHDADSDDDGLSDGAEVNTHGSDPNDADSDGDGLLDGFEVANGFDPLAGGEQTQDPDADGLDNLAEQQAGTDPHDADSDDDGLPDGEEVSRVSVVGFGSQQVISTLADGARSVFAADLDGDGDPDVLSASLIYSKIAWYENRLDEASADFGPQHVISMLAEDGADSVFASDLDGDGDLDALSASCDGDEIAWFENRLDEASADFGPQQVIAARGCPSSVLAVDLDGDGDPDVLSPSAGDHAWYENRLGEASADFGPKQVLWALWYAGGSLVAADLDGDSDPDMLSSYLDDEYTYRSYIFWHENRLDEASADLYGPLGIWFSAPMDFAPPLVIASDLDTDGDPDVVSASLSFYPTIGWYENRLDEASADFGLGDTISPLVTPIRSLFAADLDGDGNPDVLSASGGNDEIAWYENRLDEASGYFGSQQVISTLADGANEVFAADLDGDGDPDVLSASEYDDKIAWYENPGTDPLDPDSDGDGLTDGFEADNGFDPLVAGEQTLDPDGDGLDNLGEQTAGTDPHDPDSDGDGLTDGDEVNLYGTEPLDWDSDGDGASDGREIAVGTDPLDPQDVPPVPALPEPAMLLLVAVLLAAAWPVLRRRAP